MKHHLMRLAGGALLLSATATGAVAQGAINFNMTPSLDSVARETHDRNAGAVAQLLAGGGDPNQVDDGRPALVIAAIDNDTQIESMLIKAGARLNDGDEEGNTALYHAVELNHIDMARLLLDAGAAVDPENRDGVTPLMLAASRGYVGIVELLLAKGANPAKSDFTGRDVLGWAGNQPRIVQLLQHAAAQR